MKILKLITMQLWSKPLQLIEIGNYIDEMVFEKSKWHRDWCTALEMYNVYLYIEFYIIDLLKMLDMVGNSRIASGTRWNESICIL